MTYAWVNPAFEKLFDVSRKDLVGKLDIDVFKNRQSAQCNGGDLRVLESGEVDEAVETVFAPDNSPREIITRKRRLVLSDGSCFLVGILHDITDVTRANAKLESQAHTLQIMANTDYLTGVLNRRALYSEACITASNNTSGWALLALDLDHFKRVNDTHGHKAGDKALVHFCSTIKKVLRADDVIARLGGEEFAVLLMNTSKRESLDIAQRICQLVESSPCPYDDLKIPLTVSIGAVFGDANETIDLDTVLTKADDALYSAKEKGRNTVASHVA